jgi:hypothetical protein
MLSQAEPQVAAMHDDSALSMNKIACLNWTALPSLGILVLIARPLANAYSAVHLPCM